MIVPTTFAATRRVISFSPRGAVFGLLRLLWLALLILPAAMMVSDNPPWELDSRLLFGLSCWLVAATRLALPPRWFFPLSLPIALAGMLCVGAHVLRHVDLLDLALQWRTFTAEEVRSTLLPHAALVASATGLLVAWCWACARESGMRRFGRAVPVAVALLTVLLVPLVPEAAWLRAWPSNAIVVAVMVATGSQPSVHVFRLPMIVDPRDPKATWHAHATSAARRQTFVFIVGESVRADYLHECHGPALVRPLSADALVACDVTSGVDATHTSVPLLISRELPGWPDRVSSDATFEHAFEEAGFETHWIGVQDNTLAWPDATFQTYPKYTTSDEAALAQPLAATLARPARRKAIVLHAYNAHDPYCARYDHASAPYQPDCEKLRSTRVSYPEDMRLAYANAVDASAGFINGVIDKLRGEPGEAFLLFTPDHGDNLYDDPRQLHGHALENPTRWDVHVPAIFWANAAWKAAHPKQWTNLQANTQAPLMHADMVPTFLAAAGVAYDERRWLPVNLLTAAVPVRTRVIQRKPGVTTDWDTLVREAR